jgi:VWFA-related protein
MFINIRLCSFLLGSLLCTAAAIAQQPAPPADAASHTIDLDVVVTPKSGAPMGGLQQQDFTLLDNKAPQTITSFRALTGRDALTEIVLVIDAVNDTSQDVSRERIQIDKFLRADQGNLAYPIALAVFTDKGIENVASLSSDGNALGAALENDTIALRDIGRTAGLWGATERLQRSLTALNQLIAVEAPRPGRKLILWVSPGWPLFNVGSNLVDAKLQQQLFANVVAMSTDLRRAGIILYSIDPLGTAEPVLQASNYRNFLKGITKPSQAQIGDLGLQVLAVQSGGLALGGSSDASLLLQQCVTDSAPYYEISFVPSSSTRPDEYHQLEIRVDKPGSIARTRQGYYANPSFLGPRLPR